MPAPLHITFIGGAAGAWRIERINAERGESLAPAERLDMREDSGVSRPGGAVWMLRGVTSCGSGFWGGRRPSLGGYVTGTGPTRGVPAAGGR
jgi:hypothetical protein